MFNGENHGFWLMKIEGTQKNELREFFCGLVQYEMRNGVYMIQIAQEMGIKYEKLASLRYKSLIPGDIFNAIVDRYNLDGDELIRSRPQDIHIEVLRGYIAAQQSSWLIRMKRALKNFFCGG